MNKPHKHAELIKAWADGAEIEERNPYVQLLTAPPKPDPWKEFRGVWKEKYEYRIKPEPPKHPQTRMSDDDLQELWRQCVVASAPFTDHLLNTQRRFADASIARAIEDGDVIACEHAVLITEVAKLWGTPEAAEAAAKWAADMVPAAMLEKVAHAVKCKAIAAIDAHGAHVRDMYGLGGARFDVTRLDLPAIIASVREAK